MGILMKWAVDAMIGNVAKYLLFLGEDVFYDPACFGQNIANKSFSENRIIITSSRTLVHNHPEIQILHLNDSIKTIWAKLRYIKKTFNLNFDELNLFSRCTMCNKALISVDLNEKPHTVPQRVFENFQLYQCGKCKKFYWKGGHYLRTKQKLTKEKIL